MSEKINLGWWYPIIRSVEEFELLPEIWQKNTTYQAFPIHRSAMFENIEALIEQQGEKEGKPLQLVTVRATPAFMRKLIEKRYLDYNLKSIQDTAAAMGRLECFDSQRIYDEGDLHTLPPLEEPSGFSLDPDRALGFIEDPYKLESNVNKVIAVLHMILNVAVQGGMSTDTRDKIYKEIFRHLYNNSTDEEQADKICDSIASIMSYHAQED